MATELTTEPGISPGATVHPSAHVDPSASVAAGAVLETGAFVGPDCAVGPGTRLRAHAMLVERTVVGAENDVHPYAVLGGDPQDLAFTPDQDSRLIVGDRNVIREHATFNRGTGNGPPTTVGSDGYFMAASHVGHNARVGDGVIFANAVTIAGHGRVGDRCVLSGHASVHQFTEVGPGVMLRGLTGVGMHVPPYVVVGAHNTVTGLNVVGLRRSGLEPGEIQDVKRVYRHYYRDRGGGSLEHTHALALEMEWKRAAWAFVEFVGRVLAMSPPRNRGLCGDRPHRVAG